MSLDEEYDFNLESVEEYLRAQSMRYQQSILILAAGRILIIGVLFVSIWILAPLSSAWPLIAASYFYILLEIANPAVFAGLRAILRRNKGEAWKA